MTTLITPTNITFVISITGLIFGIYIYFRNPQIQTEKESAVTIKAVSDISTQLNKLDVAFQAHLTADQTAFSMLNAHVVEVDKSVVRLTTIIDERIPKKV